MVDEVKVCVDAKVNFFAEYFTVPGELEEAVSQFSADTGALGERCGSAAEFEAQFASTGLAARFHALIPKCTPKARKMTKEEKKNTAKITMQILSDNKEKIIEDTALHVAGRIIADQRDEQIAASRERMIADGTYAEHTVCQNRIRDTFALGRLIKNLFKK